MQGHTYHWKHGWIPLTPAAALTKAHGSHKGADRVMAKHGIDVPHHEHHDGHVTDARDAERAAVHKATHLTSKDFAANNAAMKAASKHSADVRETATKDPLGSELLGLSSKGHGTSARAAIVRAAEDAGQGDIDGARTRLTSALADARAMGPAYPGDTTNRADVSALRKALAALDRHKAKGAMGAPLAP